MDRDLKMNILQEIKRLIKIDRKWERLKKGNIPVPIRKLIDKLFQNKNCLIISDGVYAIWPLRKNSIVYSCGLDADASFELDLITRFNSKIYAFDPTKKSRDFLTKIKNKNLNYYSLGISERKGKFKLDDGKIYDCISLVDFANEKGHNKIDLIKLDIEGYEYNVIRKILESDLVVNQIVLELHGWMLGFSRKEDKKLKKILKKNGYKLIYKNLDNYTFVKTTNSHNQKPKLHNLNKQFLTH